MADYVMHALEEDENSFTHEEYNSDAVVSDARPIEEEQLNLLRTTIGVVEAEDNPLIQVVRYCGINTFNPTTRNEGG